MRSLRLPLWLLVAILLGACTSSDQLDVHDAEAVDAPPREAVLADGGWPEAAAWIQREAAEDTPVVMNILASWCAPCERELPVLHEAMRDNPDIAFLGIDHMDLRENAEIFVEEQQIEFATIFDIEGDVAASVGGRAMPTTAFFDRDGRMVSLASGELTATALEEHLDGIR